MTRIPPRASARAALIDALTARTAQTEWLDRFIETVLAGRTRPAVAPRLGARPGPWPRIPR